MAKSRNKRIPKGAAETPSSKGKRLTIDLTEIENSHLGVADGNNATPYVALKYFQSTHECFSNWTPDELKAFSSFNIKLQQYTWQQVYASGGKRDKTGLGYTPHTNRDVLPNAPQLDALSPEITFFELRVTQEARVHGFRSKSVFFLVWLDRGHQIYPQ